MKFQYFDVDENLCEKTQHGTEDFPLAIYIHSPNSTLAKYMPYHDKKTEDCVIPHWHNEFQFNYILEGELCYCVEGEKYLLSKGDGLFINSGCLHSTETSRDKDVVYAAINFHPRLIYGYSKEINLKYVSPVQNASQLSAIKFDGSLQWHNSILTCLQNLCTLSSNDVYTFELLALSKLLELWSFLLQNNTHFFHCEQIQLPAETQTQLDSVLYFIHTHYHESITLENIADVIHTSRETCCRFFKKTLKQSPIEYLNRVRIMKSTTLLLNTNMSISEIADSVGFCSSSYYTDRFKKMINCTPKEYRNQHISSLTQSDSPRPR